MEQRSDGRATHGAADGKTGVRRARREIVLCGKYSSTLRQVQFCTPQRGGRRRGPCFIALGMFAVPVCLDVQTPVWLNPPGRVNFIVVLFVRKKSLPSTCCPVLRKISAGQPNEAARKLVCFEIKLFLCRSQNQCAMMKYPIGIQSFNQLIEKINAP